MSLGGVSCLRVASIPPFRLSFSSNVADMESFKAFRVSGSGLWETLEILFFGGTSKNLDILDSQVAVGQPLSHDWSHRSGEYVR